MVKKPAYGKLGHQPEILPVKSILPIKEIIALIVLPIGVRFSVYVFSSFGFLPVALMFTALFNKSNQ
jgi:hypothetical protein